MTLENITSGSQLTLLLLTTTKEGHSPEDAAKGFPCNGF